MAQERTLRSTLFWGATAFLIWAGDLSAASAGDPPRPCCRKPTGALQIAAFEGNRDRVATLVDRGETSDQADEQGWTALHWAVFGAEARTAGLLLDRAADPNARDRIGMTPLHWAAMLGRTALVAPLLGRGARPLMRSRYGTTPLHEAAHPEVARALIEAGADLAAVDDQGRTPLHLARNAEMARYLIEAGADIRIRAHNGRTAIEVIAFDQAEASGLSFYTGRSSVRLKGDRVRFEIWARNVSICEIENLALVVTSPAARALVHPRKLSRLSPGEMQRIGIELGRRPEVAEGEHPVDIQVALGRARVGRLELVVDTRRAELPIDRGMIRLGKGSVRPAGPAGVRYLPFLAVPFLALAYWLWSRLRRRRR